MVPSEEIEDAEVDRNSNVSAYDKEERKEGTPLPPYPVFSARKLPYHLHP